MHSASSSSINAPENNLSAAGGVGGKVGNESPRAHHEVNHVFGGESRNDTRLNVRVVVDVHKADALREKWKQVEQERWGAWLDKAVQMKPGKGSGEEDGEEGPTRKRTNRYGQVSEPIARLVSQRELR